MGVRQAASIKLSGAPSKPFTSAEVKLCGRANSRGKAGRNPGRKASLSHTVFLSRLLLIASAIKGSFLHLCLASTVFASPAPFILIGKFQNRHWPSLASPSGSAVTSKRNSIGWEQSSGGLWSGCRCSDCNVPRGDSWKSPMGCRVLPLCLMLLPYRTASFLLAASPSQPEFPLSPFPGPAMTRAGKVSWLCSRGPWPPT